MNKSDMLDKLRFYLADPKGKIWKDDFLNDILEQSLKQYSIDSQGFVSRFDLHADRNGIYHYPEDYASILIAWNDEGKEISPITARELFHRQDNTYNYNAKPLYIYDDQSSIGDYELYPQSINREQDVSIEGFFGEVLYNDYGVFFDENYGVSLTITQFDTIGDMIYCRIGTYEELVDYMSVIYYALYLAYNTDLDFGNPDNAAIWFARYKDRMARFNAIEYHNSGIGRTVNFY